MNALDKVTADELRDCLDRVDEGTATLRIVVGINYKNGITQSELAEWYGVSRVTIHNWLERLARLEDEPLAEAVYDDQRPGRPPKLDSDQRDRLEAALQTSPSNWGIDEPDWSPGAVRRFIAEEFGVEYTDRHVRNILDDLETQ